MGYKGFRCRLMYSKVKRFIFCSVCVPLSIALSGCIGNNDRPAPAIGAAQDQTAIYRINAGGGVVISQEGLDWRAGTGYVNGGMRTAVTSEIDISHPSIPVNTPVDIFRTELWDRDELPEMEWAFPVLPGVYEVRLYFAETWAPAFNEGVRVFDVEIEGETVLDDFDIFSEVGGLRAVMKSYTVTADSSVDVRFLREAQNPAIKAIEILGQSQQTTVTNASGVLEIEAESYRENVESNTHKWEFRSTTGSDTFDYLVTTPNRGALLEGVDESPALNYNVDFPEPGTYNIWVKGRGDTSADGEGKNDSLHMGLNGVVQTSSDKIEGFPSRWSWSRNTRDREIAQLTVPSPGVHTVNVWMREDGLAIDRFILTKNSDYHPDSNLEIEAESFDELTNSRTHRWVPKSSLDASDFRYMVTTPDSGRLNTTNRNSPMMAYTVNFNRTGTYYVWVRGKGDTNAIGEGKSDSLHIGVNGELDSSADKIDIFPNEWSWSQSTRDGNVATVEVQETGINVINVWMREDGLEVDKLILTTDPLFIPSNTPADLIRINAGGEELAAADGNWFGNTRRDFGGIVNTGNTATFRGPVDLSHASVPEGTPEQVFLTERYDSPGEPEMQWVFSVTPGQFEIRLYFAETWPGAFGVGERVFSVFIEDELVLDNFDVYAEVGENKALVKEFTILSDSELEIDFKRVVQNPAIKGIELISQTSAALVATPIVQPSFGNAPLTVNFSNASLNPNVLLYEWDFNGDGVVDRSDNDGQSYDFVFAEEGTFDAALTVTDVAGDSATSQVSISVLNTPPLVTAVVTPSSGTVPLNVTFTADATDSNGIESYAWDFDGDGITDETTASPSTQFTFDNAGSFRPVVVVADTLGAETTLILPGSIAVQTAVVQVEVPAVVGGSQQEAILAIENIGLVLGDVSTESSATVDVGNVLGQSPVAGSLVVPGSVVSVVVSSGPVIELVAVPDLAGLSQTQAVDALQSAGFVTGSISEIANATVSEGLVISQSIAAGQEVQIGSAIDLVISTGTPTTDDMTPPLLSLVNLTDGALLINDNPSIELLYSDESGVDTGSLTITANGTELNLACDLGEESGVCELEDGLSEGNVTLAISLADTVGNVRLLTLEVTVDLTLVTIAIQSPASGLITAASEVEVSGTVADGVESVVVNDVQATLGGGGFTATVPLREGKNMLVAVATRNSGKTGTASADITRDIASPIVSIDSPSNSFVSVNDFIAVTGQVNDIVDGGVNARVIVNGVEATVAGGSYMVTNIPLVRGTNTITAVATDAVGNSGERSVSVTYQEPVGARIVEGTGNGQSAIVNTSLPQPLTAIVQDDVGNPVAGRVVTFEVLRNDGLLQAVDGGTAARSVQVPTDGSGRASVLMTLGDTAGEGNNRVRVIATGVAGELEFCATAVPGEPAQVIMSMGDNQRGTVGFPLATPLEALVIDEDGNPLAGVPVTFNITEGDGNLDGEVSQTVETSGNGQARTVLTLGLSAGINNNVVAASVANPDLAPATFVSSGVVPGNPEDTKFSGVVLDNGQNAIPGAVIHIHGSDTTATTDENGQFLLEDVPVGQVHLEIDPTNSPRPETFPKLEFETITVAGQINILGQPILIPAIQTEGSRLVGGDSDVILRMPGVEGLELKVFANSVTCLDGSSQCQVSISQVHMDKVPMAPPNGGAFMPPAWTLQPAGTKFDPPAQITIPNNGLPPGRVIEFYQFDHAINEFVDIGKGTVSEDGLHIVSDIGFGITRAGWGGGGPPPPPVTEATNDLCEEAAQATREHAKNIPENQQYFANSQACIAEKVCAQSKEDSFQDNDWARRVVPRFIARYLQNTGDWQDTLDGRLCNTDLVNPFDRQTCPAAMASRHIFDDLLDTLILEGCGTEDDWNDVFDNISQCQDEELEALFPTGDEVNLTQRILNTQVKAATSSVNAGAVFLMRGAVRTNCCAVRATLENRSVFDAVTGSCR